MDKVDEYLCIPAAYGRALGGLRWSADGDVITYEDGSTFAFRGEIVSFLEGFAQRRPLPNFGLVLHLLDLLRRPRPDPADPLNRLHRSFGIGARICRNAAVFCAVLCREIPSAPEPPSSQEIWRRVILPSFSTAPELLPHRHQGEEPPLTPKAFTEHVREALTGYDDKEVLHWFWHGRGLLKDSPARLVEALDVERNRSRDQPRSLREVLTELAQQERLAPAIPFVAQMVSALSLPPRRMGAPELPLGGYADVGTRGQPEQILPGQFALDELEFVRRYAERELLYYRREEPQVQTREELALLLDQGVRTWGSVRLVLTAALLAFGQLAQRRGLPLLIGSTSGDGVLHDPLKLASEQLAGLVQASDLTANPALALERALQEEPGRPRDVVLLTHPFNLDEADLAAAARRLRPDCRLFALTVDNHGQVQLSELRSGVPLVRSRFQVDLEPRSERSSEAPRPPRPKRMDPRSWQGDVEPIGYPFRFGVENDPKGQVLFAFDHSGEWLLTATAQGMLHAWRTDGSHSEVWPRGMIGGEVVRDVQAVLGVVGGFVVAGVLGGNLVAVHYDLRERRCRARVLLAKTEIRSTATSDVVRWMYDRELHCVVLHETAPRQAWDLAGEPGLTRADQKGRAFEAVRKALRYPQQPPYLEVTSSAPEALDHGWVELDERTGRIDVFVPELGRRQFTPEEDGHPALSGWQAIRAQFAGSTLVLAVVPVGNPRANVRLHLYRLPDGVYLGEYTQPCDHWAHVLSDDGRLLARQINPMQVQACTVGERVGAPWTTAQGGFHVVPLVALASHACVRSGRQAGLRFGWRSTPRIRAPFTSAGTRGS